MYANYARFSTWAGDVKTGHHRSISPVFFQEVCVRFQPYSNPPLIALEIESSNINQSVLSTHAVIRLIGQGIHSFKLINAVRLIYIPREMVASEVRIAIQHARSTYRRGVFGLPTHRPKTISYILRVRFHVGGMISQPMISSHHANFNFKK